MSERAMCAVCDTPLTWCGAAGWRHTLGFKSRDNCNIPWPGLPIESSDA